MAKHRRKDWNGGEMAGRYRFSLAHLEDHMEDHMDMIMGRNIGET